MRKRKIGKTTRRSSGPASRKARLGANRPVTRLRLPGMEDEVLEAIERLAAVYEVLRDERIAANKPEKKAKQDLIVAMKMAGKQHYRRGDLDVQLTVEKESIHVRRIKATRKTSEADSGDLSETG
mgnify:CR=1 FL=1